MILSARRGAGYYYNARWYDAKLGRFAQADIIIPNAGNPSNFDRYTYGNNNPPVFKDPSGHFIVPVIALVVIGVVILLSIPSTEPQIPPNDAEIGNYPVNNNYLGDCPYPSLPDCFGDEVYYEDFSDNSPENPISKEEFEALLSKVADDLFTHDVQSPGDREGRSTYDTPFYRGGGASELGGTVEQPPYENRYIYIQGTSGGFRSDINYIAQGMWSARAGEPMYMGELIVRVWNYANYNNIDVDAALYWFRYGYEYYLEWLKENGKTK